MDKLGGGEHVTISLRRRLNDPEGAFMQGDLKRLYIYSQADKLVPADEVESHGREAIAIIGADRVRLEDFVTSTHVGHVREDGRRYWSLIDKLWEESNKI